MNFQRRITTFAIGEIAEVNPKGPAKGELGANEEFDFLPMADLHESGSIRIASTRPYEEVAKGYTAFKSGDVLVAKITPCFENNKIALADVSTEWGFGSTEFHVLRSGPDLDSKYLTHFLRQDSIREAGEKRMTGSAGQRRVPKVFLEELQIPLPPLPEQKRIAGILDQADALRRLRARALEKLNALGQAIFQEMFGDAPIVNAYKFGDAVEEFRYGTSNKSGPAGLPTLRIPNVIGGGINTTEIKTVQVSDSELNRLRLRDGDMLFVRTNGNSEYVGRCAVFSVSELQNTGFHADWIFASYLIRARLSNQVNPVFAKTYFASRTGRSAIRERCKTSAGQFNINTEGLASLPFPDVSRAKQDKFADAMASIMGTHAPLQQAVIKMDEMFASLQHRAFRGEL